MIRRDRAFLAEFEAWRVDAPPAGEADFAFTDGRGRSWACTVTVDPWSGPAWTATFTVDPERMTGALSGLFRTPSLTTLCVVERGVAFLVDVLRPSDGHLVPTDGPVVGVEELVDEAYLLLLTPWTITAVTAGGAAWTSRRVALDGIRVDGVDDGWLFGVADPSDEPHGFAIDLRTGEMVGGAGVS
jgi:hypothetical protein